MESEELDYQSAYREYRDRVARAKSGLSVANARLKRARRLAETTPTELIQTFTSTGAMIALRRDSIEISTPESGRHRYPVTANLLASVDSAGNLAIDRRATLTRIAAGGLVAGPVGAILGSQIKKKSVTDTRELYLLIEGADFAVVVKSNPNKSAEVRSLAAQINTLARQRASSVDAVDYEVSATLSAVQSAQQAVYDAESAVLDALENREELDAALAALIAAGGEAPELPEITLESTEMDGCMAANVRFVQILIWGTGIWAVIFIIVKVIT